MKVKNFFKFGTAAVVLVCGMCMTSCCSEPAPLTADDVENEVEKFYGPEYEHFNVATIKTGYYEAEAYEIETLAKLQAAGVLTYKAENIIETRHGWYSKNKYDHYFVEVTLTEEGQKYVVSDEEYAEWEEESKYVDSDFEDEEVAEEVSEDSVVAQVLTALADIPVIDDDPEVAAQAKAQPANDNTYEEEAPEVVSDSSSDTPAVAPQSAYEKAMANVNVVEVRVKTYKMDLYKVRYVKCTQNMFEDGVGSAVIIFEVTDCTPFGEILSNKKEGKKSDKDRKFELFEEGWRLSREVEKFS